jgi:hypothetical protein
MACVAMKPAFGDQSARRFFMLGCACAAGMRVFPQKYALKATRPSGRELVSKKPLS